MTQTLYILSINVVIVIVTQFAFPSSNHSEIFGSALFPSYCTLLWGYTVTLQYHKQRVMITLVWEHYHFL